MPRIAAVATEIAEHIVAGKPLPPPPELTPQEATFWRELVGASPAKRFGSDARPVLVELVRAMAVAGVIAEQINGMRSAPLACDTKEGAKTRSMFLQLATAARAQSMLISALSTRLRLTEQAAKRKSVSEAERRASPTGPRPWDAERHDN